VGDEAALGRDVVQATNGHRALQLLAGADKKKVATAEKLLLLWRHPGRENRVCQDAGTREYIYLHLPKEAEEPDLREYDGPPFHYNILFDEASPKLVINKKDLFQSPKHDVDMGTSSTNCYAYKVHVWGVRMIICTNKWHEQVRELPEQDQQWLAKNVIVYDVQGSLFTDEPL